MNQNEQATQIKVGFFLLIGFVMIGAMVVYFGRLGEGLKQYYSFRVEFPNASGLRSGADVLMAGAKVGRVSDGPFMLPNLDGVYVDLKVYDYVKIPSNSAISIGSSGLLGDRFVQIVPNIESKNYPPLEGGALVKGVQEGGSMDALTQQGGEMLAEMRQAVSKVNLALDRVNNGFLQEETLAELNATVSNLRETSAAFAEASKKIDGIMAEAKVTIQTGNATLQSAKSAADEVTQTVAEARSLIREAKQGRGVVGMLLSNREAAENIQLFVANLRRHGILWYKDTEKKAGSPAGR